MKWIDNILGINTEETSAMSFSKSVIWEPNFGTMRVDRYELYDLCFDFLASDRYFHMDSLS